MTSTLKVVQWATGTVGMRSLGAVLDHPTLELVGLYVYSDAKAGVDAGTVYGVDPVGVTATRDVGEIVALRADCVLYMPFTSDIDDMVAILESGTNIVTTKTEFQNPDFLDDQVRTRLESACERGGSSLFATGSSPGTGSEHVPATLLGFVRRLDRLTVDEYADSSSYDSAGIVLDAMGFGSPPTEATVDRLISSLERSRRQSAHTLANALGVTLDGIETRAEIALATKRTEIAVGVIEEGTIAGTRLTVTGTRGGEPFLTFRTNWYCTRDLDVDWGDLLYSGWRIAVQGDTPVDVEITFPIPMEDYAAVTPGLTAHPAVNAVAAVCAARPGIVRFLDLPYILPTLA